MTKPSRFLPDPMEQAIAWHTRLMSGEETESDWHAFRLWLEENPEHRLAYEGVEDFSFALSRTALSQNSEAARLVQAAKDRATPVLRIPFIWVAGALASVAALLLLLLLGIPKQKTEIANVEYTTRIGETRGVRLADGSVADLNTNTKMRVLPGSTERRVELARGEVLFHVVKDPARPFEVLLGQQAVRVVGTVFDVLRTSQSLSVTVAEGRVRYSDRTTGQTVSLSVGDQLIYRPSTGAHKRRVNARSIAAWRQGYLVYDNSSLADIVEDLNRYFARPIVVADSAAAGQKFSGILHLDTEEAVLNRLARLLPIKADYRDKNVIRLHSSAKRD